MTTCHLLSQSRAPASLACRDRSLLGTLRIRQATSDSVRSHVWSWSAITAQSRRHSCCFPRCWQLSQPTVPATVLMNLTSGLPLYRRGRLEASVGSSPSRGGVGSAIIPSSVLRKMTTAPKPATLRAPRTGCQIERHGIMGTSPAAKNRMLSADTPTHHADKAGSKPRTFEPDTRRPWGGLSV